MNRVSRAAYLAAVYLFFYFPIAVLIVFSFNNSEYSLLWHGFTLDWYKELLADIEIQTVALHSLVVGILAATIATILGTLTSVCLYWYRFKGRNVLYGMIFVMIVSPDIVLAISLLILFATLKIELGFWTLLLAHITFCMPFVAVTVFSRITGLDKNIFEAAKDLGATDLTILCRVVVPLLWPAIIAGWLLSFTLSLDDVIISFFMTGPEFNILPLEIFSMVRLGVKPELNALCSVMFGLTLLIVLVSQFALRKKQ